MLTITVGGTDSYDEESQEFIVTGGFELQLEHSLVALSKWESKHEKPFLGGDQKTAEEVFDYVRCMTLTEKVPAEIFYKLSDENFATIQTYMDAKQTATWFAQRSVAPRTSEVITNELIYYWMTVFQIPFECQHWHINRLFTLIQICNLKQDKPKKMTRGEIAARNRELNEQRKKQLGTSG